MQLSGLRSRIQQRKAGGTGMSASRKEPIAYGRKEPIAYGREMESNAKAKSYKNDNEIAFKNEYNRLNSGYFIEIKKLSHMLQLSDFNPRQYRQEGIYARKRLNEINAEISQRAHAYADSKYPSSGLSGLDRLGAWGYSGASARSSKDGYVASGYLMQSEAQADVNCHDAGGVYVGGRGCQFPPAQAASAPPANVTVSPRFNVSPVIQTQISPQISPAFQQAFQPSNSPMTAGTSQNMPTSQAAAPPVPTYQPPPAPAPTAAPDQSAALLAQQQKMIDLLQSQLQAPRPTAPALAAPPAPAQIAPPMPQQYAAPLPIQSAAPLPADPTAPVSVDTGLPQYGLSTAGQTAAAAFSAQAAPPVPATVTPVQPAAPKSNMPMILAILAGAGILFVSMNQKGKRHATR